MQWNKVTWYSKLLALIFFVCLPFLGFYLGIRYEKLSQKADVAVAIDEKDWRTYQNETYGFALAYPPDWNVVESNAAKDIDIYSPNGAFFYISLNISPFDGEHRLFSDCPVLTHVLSCVKLRNPNGILYIREASTGQLQLDRQEQLDDFWGSSTADVQMTLTLTDAKGQPLQHIDSAKDIFQKMMDSVKVK